MNICPGYIVLTLDRSIFIEPYTPNHLACQSSYDQLYVGNLNQGFQRGRSLLEAAKAWYYNVSDWTSTKFWLPAKHSEPHLCLNFEKWYSHVWRTLNFDWRHPSWNLSMMTLRWNQPLKMPFLFVICGCTEQYAIWTRTTRRLVKVQSLCLLNATDPEELQSHFSQVQWLSREVLYPNFSVDGDPK